MRVQELLDLLPPDNYVIITDAWETTLEEGVAADISAKFREYDIGATNSTVIHPPHLPPSPALQILI